MGEPFLSDIVARAARASYFQSSPVTLGQDRMRPAGRLRQCHLINYRFGAVFLLGLMTRNR